MSAGDSDGARDKDNGTSGGSEESREKARRRGMVSGQKRPRATDESGGLRPVRTMTHMLRAGAMSPCNCAPCEVYHNVECRFVYSR